MTVLSSSELKKRIDKARHLFNSGESNEAFATLLLESADARWKLLTISEWPTEVYRQASREIRLQLYRCLLSHRKHSPKESWVSAWYHELFELDQPGQQKAEEAARDCQELPVSSHTQVLYPALFARFPSSGRIAICWMRHLSGKDDRSVVEHAPEVAKSFTPGPIRVEILTTYVTSLLELIRSGDTVSAQAGQTHGETALHTLLQIDSEGMWDESQHRDLLELAATATLPADLQSGRGAGTYAIADAFRQLTNFSRARIPYNETTIESCPRLLSPAEIEASIAGEERISREFQDVNRGTGVAEALTVAGVVSGQQIWAMSQIDSSVLDAVSFSSAGHPQGFAKIREIAETIQGRSGEAYEGSVHRLEGYVAEQQVALDLTRQGHQVEFPETANEAAWDLMVDGTAVNVKNTMSPTLIQEHLERYPDIPVIANAEMAPHFEGNDRVWIDGDLTNEAVSSTTNETLEALDGFGEAEDLLPIPFLSLGFAAFRNFDDYSSGKIQGDTYARNIAVEAGSRTVGGGAGATVGGLVGWVLGPLGSMVGAGLGGFVGSVVGGAFADNVNRPALCDARDDAVNELADFARWFRRNLLEPRIAKLQARRDEVVVWAKRASQRSRCPVFTARVTAASLEMVERATGLRSWLDSKLEQSTPFEQAHAGWVALNQCGSFLHPELRQRIARVHVALDAYRGLKEGGKVAVTDPVSC